MKAFVFPGQGAQYAGMGKDLMEKYSQAKHWLTQADQILGYSLSSIMIEGSEEEMKATKITQPAIFLHSFIEWKEGQQGRIPDMAAGHSLGEFTALAISGALSFEDALQLVQIRALAMQKACDAVPSTMAAVLGLEDEQVEVICIQVDDIVVPANYNSPGQLVISGTIRGVDDACVLLKEAGAKRVLKLQVAGAFHSPLMEPARAELADALRKIEIKKPSCPIYQNVSAMPTQDPELIRAQLNQQLTEPVKWTQTITKMHEHGAFDFVELGPGNVLTGLIKKILPLV